MPPARGSSDWAVTAEKVVKPAQNPGSKRSRNSVTPRRSIKTRSAEASATPRIFAAKVPWRSLGKISPNPKRNKVPAIPPMETNARDFRAEELSCRQMKLRELQGK